MPFLEPEIYLTVRLSLHSCKTIFSSFVLLDSLYANTGSTENKAITVSIISKAAYNAVSVLVTDHSRVSADVTGSKCCRTTVSLPVFSYSPVHY